MTIRQRFRDRGLRVHWAWVPAGVFGLFAAWYEGGWLRIALVLIVAVGLVALATHHSRQR